MVARQRLVPVCVLVLVVTLGSAPATSATEKDTKDKGTIAGLAIEKKPKMILVQADGKDEAVEYVLPDGADRLLLKAWNSVFNASRVRLSYKLNGDKREVTAISRQVGRPRGTITGVVVRTYNGFWVSVKPKGRVVDAFASSSAKPPALLKTLEQGDVVTIQYYTDFERHRIITIRKHETTRKK